MEILDLHHSSTHLFMLSCTFIITWLLSVHPCNGTSGGRSTLQSSNWFNLPLELHTPSKSTTFLGVIIQEELPPLSSWRQSFSLSSSSASTRGLIGTEDIHQRQRRRTWMERWPRLNHPENPNIWAFIQGRQQQSLLSQLWSNGSLLCVYSLLLPMISYVTPFIRLP